MLSSHVSNRTLLSDRLPLGPRLCGLVLLVLTAALLSGSTPAQTPPEQTKSPEKKLTSSYDRLFLGFIQDAVLADKQWWEGQAQILDREIADLALIRGIVALQPWENFEIGGSVGFGSTDTPAGIPDGRGATDLDVWGKYYLGSNSDDVEFAVGGLLTLPTGDDSEGLGFDAFGIGAFSSLRYRLPRVIVTASVGLQFNEDGETAGASNLDGKTVASLGGGVIYPFSDQASFVGEFQFNTERFEDLDNDVRVLGGINWRAFNRGVLRGAIGIGLSDGAPDLQVIAGYAVVF